MKHPALMIAALFAFSANADALSWDDVVSRPLNSIKSFFSSSPSASAAPARAGSGKRSAAALKIMQDMGFSDVHDIAGGITAWQAAGLPVVK